jgi:Leucine-rich repeat (LRR) protein
VTRSGFCALESRRLNSIPLLPSLSIRSLNLGGNPFRDFKGLAELPNLETLCLDDTGLLSFKHAVPQLKLRPT